MSTATGDHSLPGSACSIVIPLYNRAAMIVGCLDSLRPALDLGYEVIVVDDGSGDDGADIVEAWAQKTGAAVRCIRQKNAGPGAARNTGVAASQRDWIVFLDSDDLWLPWSAAHILEAITGHSESVAIFFATENFGPGEEPLTTWRAAPTHIASFADFFAMRDAVVSGLVGSGCVTIKRAVFAQLDGFVTDIRSGEDMDLFFRLEGPVARISDPVIVALRTDNSDKLTLSAEATFQGLRHTLKQLQTGAYPNPRARAAIADSLSFWLHTLCNTGHGKEAYSIFFGSGGWRLMWAEGRQKHMIRLLLHPVLAVIRPKNYQFGWTSLS